MTRLHSFLTALSLAVLPAAATAEGISLSFGATLTSNELRPVFRTVCLLTLRGHFPSHIFESLFWRFVADA